MERRPLMIGSTGGSSLRAGVFRTREDGPLGDPRSILPYHRSAASAISSAMSFTCTSPSSSKCFTPSVSMVMQKGSLQR